eukprot:GHVP01040754.1.p1 GENE.GHVP01040754.1~~GHVP01040754.1.p1  ORF type:complete len:206 (-),score=41.84 GHVP01040754.1:495-1112(-)
MTKVILYYVPAAGRGYIPRMVMEYGGIDYEWKKVSMEEVKSDKETYPFGMVPVFEIDGEMWHQSFAAGYYLATKAGLVGDDTPKTRARIIEVSGLIEDYMGKLSPTFRITVEEEKLAARKVVSEWARSHFTALDKKLASNSKCAIGDQLTYVDMLLCMVAHWTRKGILDGIDADITNLPIFDKSVKAVESEPKLKKFIADFPIGG